MSKNIIVVLMYNRHKLLDLNALAENLLDNSETTHRLERYTVLSLPDRPK
jgi:hypothetical protein